MAKVRFTKRGNIGERLQNLYKANGYTMPKDALSVVREMVERGLIELNDYVESDRYGNEKEHTKKEEQNVKNTILKHLKYVDVSKVSVEWICCYADFFHCPIAYLYGETDIAYNLGLNSDSLGFLMTLNRNADKMPIASEMINTLNVILSDTDKSTDLLQAVGDMIGTVNYTASGADIPDFDNGTIDGAFLRVVQERRLQMAVDNFKNDL